MTAQQLKGRIAAFLAGQHVMSLATTASDTGAHAASLFYAFDDLSLVWTSDPGTRHSRHLLSHPRVCATIAPDTADFLSVRGLQIAGVARRLEAADEVEIAVAALLARFPFLRQLAGGPPALRAAWAKAGFYRLDPEHITLIDNSQGFGHKATLHVSADGAIALADAPSH